LAKRGSNSFKRNDGIRALRIARDGGMEPSALEVVVGTDGAVTFRVYGDKAAPTPSNAASDEWVDAIEEVKAKTKAPKTKTR
jgi:plastocyanin domain-containing protein